jgi:hypothetical protein
MFVMELVILAKSVIPANPRHSGESRNPENPQESPSFRRKPESSVMTIIP